MSFSNEYISAEDFARFNLRDLNTRPSWLKMSPWYPSDSWTIDRDADIWLRKVLTESDHTASDGGYTGVSLWNFYWKGVLMFVTLKTIETTGGVGQPCWAKKKLLSMDLPDDLKKDRARILEDLEAALIAYKDGGVFSASSEYSLTLEA